MEERTELVKVMQTTMGTQTDFLAPRMNANRAEIRTIHTKTDAYQSKTDANLREVKEEVMSRMDSQLEKEKACLVKTEATDLEENSDELESEAVHEEVPNEEPHMKNFGALNERYVDRYLAVRHRGKPKEQTMMGPGRSSPPPPTEG